jgi:hypothetical protein
MKSRNVLYSLVIILVMLTLALIKIGHEPKQKEAFNRNINDLDFTTQALCEMNCYGVTKEAIYEVMQHGVININGSDRRARPCPLFALQKRTKGNQYVRVIFAQCEKETKVITCYDWEKKLDCDCSGAH